MADSLMRSGYEMRVVFKDGRVLYNVWEIHYSREQGMGIVFCNNNDPVDHDEVIFEDDEILKIEFVE